MTSAELSVRDLLTGVAILLGMVTTALAVLRQRRDDERRAISGQIYQTREQQLEAQIAMLTSQVDKLKRDIDGLTRLLTEKQVEIDRLYERIRQLERANTAPAARTRRPTLLVATANDAMLEEDVAALRGVRAFHLQVLRNATSRDLERTLERARAEGHPVQYLHLATHAGPQGMALADRAVNGIWLSEHVRGVEILVLLGCRSDYAGDLLSVVPAVVSMRDEISNSDARIFARAFWAAIGEGLAVEDALDRALERSPSAVGEMVELHL